jgi:hypothetical protein
MQAAASIVVTATATNHAVDDDNRRHLFAFIFLFPSCVVAPLAP